jgi:carbonic anhydrase/acetyltransferase-like protein (isoleucine patch superfamily)
MSERAGQGGGRLLPYGGHHPKLADDVFVAPGAVLVGDVELAAGASVWFNCVLRGDVAAIRIGARSNIQDGSVVHADPGYPTQIGDDVLIGHMAIIHGCTIEKGGFVGMGAIVMSGATIEAGAMLAAGAMLTGGKTVGAGELWAGRPAKYLRHLTDDEQADMLAGAAHYHANAGRFLAEAEGWDEQG